MACIFALRVSEEWNERKESSGVEYAMREEEGREREREREGLQGESRTDGMLKVNQFLEPK